MRSIVAPSVSCCSALRERAVVVSIILCVTIINIRQQSRSTSRREKIGVGLTCIFVDRVNYGKSGCQRRELSFPRIPGFALSSNIYQRLSRASSQTARFSRFLQQLQRTCTHDTSIPRLAPRRLTLPFLRSQRSTWTSHRRSIDRSISDRRANSRHEFPLIYGSLFFSGCGTRRWQPRVITLRRSQRSRLQLATKVDYGMSRGRKRRPSTSRVIKGFFGAVEKRAPPGRAGYRQVCSLYISLSLSRRGPFVRRRS